MGLLPLQGQARQPSLFSVVVQAAPLPSGLLAAVLEAGRLLLSAEQLRVAQRAPLEVLMLALAVLVALVQEVQEEVAHAGLQAVVAAVVALEMLQASAVLEAVLFTLVAEAAVAQKTVLRVPVLVEHQFLEEMAGLEPSTRTTERLEFSREVVAAARKQETQAKAVMAA